MKTTWKIDPAHSSAQFVVRHMMITNVRGGFSGVQGTVVYDPADLSSSSVDVAIDKSTLSTGDANRDAHVKGAEFLDVENYPTITFKSKKITKDGDGLKITGDLTLHNSTETTQMYLDARHAAQRTSLGPRQPQRPQACPLSAEGRAAAFWRVSDYADSRAHQNERSPSENPHDG